MNTQKQINQTYRDIYQAAHLVHTGQAATVQEAYSIVDGTYEVPQQIHSMHQRTYQVGAYRDKAYTNSLARTKATHFVRATVRYFTSNRSYLLKEAIY